VPHWRGSLADDRQPVALGVVSFRGAEPLDHPTCTSHSSTLPLPCSRRVSSAAMALLQKYSMAFSPCSHNGIDKMLLDEYLMYLIEYHARHQRCKPTHFKLRARDGVRARDPVV
jgi:hypothetical protein